MRLSDGSKNVRTKNKAVSSEVNDWGLCVNLQIWQCLEYIRVRVYLRFMPLKMHNIIYKINFGTKTHL